MTFRLFLTVSCLGLLGFGLSGCKDEADVSAVGDVHVEIDVPAAEGSSAIAMLDSVLRRTEESIRPEPRRTVTGHYLASQFAQNRKDWAQASDYLDHVLSETDENGTLLKMAMILSAGSGDVEGAIATAKELEGQEDAGALAPLFKAVGLFKAGKFKAAKEFVATMPKGGLADFIHPLLSGWAKAGSGEFDISALKSNTIHLNHAVLISDFLDKPDRIKPLLDNSVNAHNISVGEIETIADGYAYIEAYDQAGRLYEEILKQYPNDRKITAKRDAVKSKTPVELGFQRVTTPTIGLAQAMYDMAMLLYREGSDDSSKVFANLALYLNPDMYEPLVLMAEISSRNENFVQTIEFLEKIPADTPNYIDVRREIAELYEKTDKPEMALYELEALYEKHGDLQSLISMGDLQRSRDDFKQAVATYNRAEKAFGKPAKDGSVHDGADTYWYLFYVRGMAYEQDGNWKRAEADLEQALSYRPDNPYVLNYLGYAWADLGMNLDTSLEMIKKAVSLRPRDGYITDSLGWVYYKLNRFEEAVVELEKAVELMPYDPTINDHLGDAYWQVGRKLEARFQWERAKNYSEDDEQSVSIEEKLLNGLETQTPSPVKKAEQTDADEKLPAL